MSDEDFDPFVGGPPPDPSERTWRHPSEVAAQANAEAAAKLASTPRRRWPVPGWRTPSRAGALVAGSLGAAACLTGFALIQIALGADTDDSTVPEIAGPSGTLADDSTDLDIAAAAASLSPTTVSVPTTIAVSETQPMALSTTASAAVEDQLVGIAVGSDLVASGVLVDGYLITSASSVGNQLSVSYSHEERWGLAYLVGVDPYSDLAVFRPSAESRAGQTLEALTTNVGRPPEEWNSEPSAASSPDPQPADQVIVATLTDDGVHSSIGNILGAGRNGMTADGQPLIGLIETSILRPEHCGGLLLDVSGNVVGVAVNTTSSLISAIPIRDAVGIADRLTRQGWANETWIGFVGLDQDTGVEVVDVTANGPAAIADLRPGDMIRYLDGARIDHMGGITAGLRRANPGDIIAVVVERAGELIALRIEVSAYAADITAEPQFVDAIPSGTGSDPLSEPIDG